MHIGLVTLGKPSFFWGGGWGRDLCLNEQERVGRQQITRGLIAV